MAAIYMTNEHCLESQVPSDARWSSTTLILLKKGSCVVLTRPYFRLELHFAGPDGEEVHVEDLVDRSEGSLWSEFKKFVNKYSEESRLVAFKRGGLEFIEANAGRQVKKSYPRNLGPYLQKPRFEFLP